MYKHILIATDGSDMARNAVMHGLRLAKALEAKVTVVVVTDPWPVLEIAQKAKERAADPIGDYEKHAAEWANNVLEQARKCAAEAGTQCQTLHVADKHPSDGILAAADELGCDAIVMSSHGRRGLRRIVLGSQASDVVSNAKTPVIIVK